VGTGVAPVVALREIVMLGFVPLQPEQKNSTSIRLSLPVTVGVNVCPPHAVFVKPKPLGVTLEFCAAVLSGAASWTTPGLVVRSQLVGTPRWKVVWLLSVKQPLEAAVVSAKFRVSTPPSGTGSVV